MLLLVSSFIAIKGCCSRFARHSPRASSHLLCKLPVTFTASCLMIVLLQSQSNGSSNTLMSRVKLSVYAMPPSLKTRSAQASKKIAGRGR